MHFGLKSKSMLAHYIKMASENIGTHTRDRAILKSENQKNSSRNIAFFLKWKFFTAQNSFVLHFNA